MLLKFNESIFEHGFNLLDAWFVVIGEMDYNIKSAKLGLKLD